MKKRLALLLCAVLLCSVFALPISAANSVPVIVSSIETTADTVINAGDEFDITVSIGAVDALAAVEVKIRYDKTVMTAVGATKEGFLNACMMADVNLSPVTPDTTDPDRYGEIWITGLAQNDQRIASEQVLTTIRFRAVKKITAQTNVECYRTPLLVRADMAEYDVTTQYGGVMYTPASGVTSTTSVEFPPIAYPQETTTTIVTTTEPTVTAPTLQAPLSDGENGGQVSAERAAGFAIPKWMHTIGAIVLIACGAGLLFVGVIVVIIAAIINNKRKKR